MRDINLDGGEISILKSLGLSGTPVHGKQLLARAQDMMSAELIDTLSGLISLGYVLSDKSIVRTVEDVEHSIFRINQAYARELKDAIHPSRARERQGRRERRR
ncbi:MAG: hypothetical protein M3R10_04090 [Verrucomicrobiota bacterium]|nr:hypothetical protein [Verrucomicrobiota bacterium]